VVSGSVMVFAASGSNTELEDGNKIPIRFALMSAAMTKIRYQMIERREAMPPSTVNIVPEV
jgi:hypothetical protein